ncbi:hypothetical protein PPTG_09685 [Phytophthora nicotianae INRA-310]|uniref:Uncharacterized protein n=1 Tax=Phytophthora nicotianae (strain INRA-310) TaxID=761204 RepID=W2QHM6_PHYN3|nr:hypothetical protein PPTG_09685 [Phytophthora nicotianae INRA-310]ETN12034.1 hypothetical protein PPTG_09685 [Phytophthora nicotianae INRA-310]
MADRLIHNRVFKVSKELNRLDLLCEQHRRQIDHREGLPDWERPNTPAGKASGRHGRTPAFFAWNEESNQRSRPTWQTETPQKVARTLHLTPTRDREQNEARQPAPERSPYKNLGGSDPETTTVLQSEQVEHEGMDEASAIEVYSDDKSAEEEQPVVTGRTIAVSPMREDILDRVYPPATTTVPQRNATSLEAASPYHPPSSPRYRHGRRLQASDAAIPTSRAQQYAAGVTTEQADRYRMSRSSGKRFRSPAKRTTLWDDLCNSYIHQSGANNSNNTNTTNFSHKRIARAAAERAFGGSSVFRTLNMDSYGWPGSESGQRRPVMTGPEAMTVANHAVREFLGGRDEECKQSEPPTQSSTVTEAVETSNEVPSSSTPESRTGNNRKSKRVSFGGDNTQPQPRTLPVLADKTTQTEDSLLPARPQSRIITRDSQTRDYGSPVRCPACDTVVDESGRPRKVPRSSTNSDAAASTQQRNYRRTSSHLTNPIMINPRYPPEPTIFRGRSTYSSAFNDRLAWR